MHFGIVQWWLVIFSQLRGCGDIGHGMWPSAGSLCSPHCFRHPLRSAHSMAPCRALPWPGQACRDHVLALFTCYQWHPNRLTAMLVGVMPKGDRPSTWAHRRSHNPVFAPFPVLSCSLVLPTLSGSDSSFPEYESQGIYLVEVPPSCAEIDRRFRALTAS